MYLSGTKEIVLWPKVEHQNVLNLNIDASYAIHHGMKGHTEASMSTGVGTLHGNSIKIIRTRGSR